MRDWEEKVMMKAEKKVGEEVRERREQRREKKKKKMKKQVLLRETPARETKVAR